MARWGCRDCHTQFGAWLSRCPRCRSAKELVAALNVCSACTTQFAVGLKRCPHCGSTDFVEDEPMAKITAHGGASDKTLHAAPEPKAAPDMPAVDEPQDVTEDLTGLAPAEPAAKGGDQSSPGSSSSASTETPQQSSEPSETPSPSPARTTGSRSKKGRTANSSASGTAGAQETGTSQTGSADA